MLGLYPSFGNIHRNICNIRYLHWAVSVNILTVFNVMINIFQLHLDISS